MTNFSSQEILSFEIIGGVLISGIIYYIYKKGKNINKEINYLSDILSLPPKDRENIINSSRRLERTTGNKGRINIGGTHKKSRKKTR